MMKRQMLAALLVVFAVGCSGNGPTAAPPPPGPGEVAIQGFAFNPTPRSVSAGTTVTWINRDATSHTTTGGAGAETWDSGALSENGTFSHTFTTPGSYQYACMIHPGMQGTITVN